MHKILLAPLVALALTAPAHAATPITSTFDSGTEGWMWGSFQGGLTTASWDSATQSLAKINHGFGGWGFVAPSSYLGDKSAYLNGVFSFDLADSAPSAAYADRPALILTGANGKTIFARSEGLPGTTSTTFSFELDADSFYSGGLTGVRNPVSDSDFAAILADLEQAQILGDWSPNVESIYLDNVMMAANAAVPEPGTWALMILGFGAAGATLRRRRAGFAA